MSEQALLFAMDRLGIQSSGGEKERRRAVRLVSLMHGRHGHGPDGATCKGCAHWVTKAHYAGLFRKCELYRADGFDSSDWRGKWPACGSYQQTREGQS